MLTCPIHRSVVMRPSERLTHLPLLLLSSLPSLSSVAVAVLPVDSPPPFPHGTSLSHDPRSMPARASKNNESLPLQPNRCLSYLPEDSRQLNIRHLSSLPSLLPSPAPKTLRRNPAIKLSLPPNPQNSMLCFRHGPRCPSHLSP